MNVLFLTLVEIHSIEERGIYQDLLRKFKNEGYKITVVTPVERRKGIQTNLIEKEGVSILQVKTLNIQKTNIIEKGIGTILIEYQYLNAVKKYTENIKFDLVLYSTPPITVGKVIEFIKERDNAYSYLLLKDIFPQNAVDMKMLKYKSFFHRQFVKKEKMLYQISDTIGCMSPANLDFILKHNPEISRDKIEVNPNSIEPIDFSYTKQEEEYIRCKYDLPINKKILVYGGNLGVPQGLNFLIETISTSVNEDLFFLIVGNGTEFTNIESWFLNNKPINAKLIKTLSKGDYDRLLSACDIGLIFLHKDFTIPNFPSRLLSYLEMKMPVLAATDVNTDIGDIIEMYNCGVKVIAGNQNQMQEKLNFLLQSNLEVMGENAKKLLLEKYTVDISFCLIKNKLKNV